MPSIIHELQMAAEAANRVAKKALAGTGVLSRQLHMMLIIRDNPGIQSSDLQRIGGFSRAMSSQYGKQLAKLGYVTMKVDGRQRQFSLTKKGLTKVSVFAEKFLDADLRVSHAVSCDLVHLSGALGAIAQLNGDDDE